MRLRYIVAMCILGTIIPHSVMSFEIRRRREVPDTPENYKYYIRPFVVPEPERLPQPDLLLKAQSVSESTSVKQYKPPLLAVPSSNQPSGGYQPPLPLLPSVPRSPEVPQPSVPFERKPLLYPTPEIAELSQSPPDRRSGTIDNRSKAVGSSHHPSQAIHQVPASEIQSDKGASAKDRDSAKDEYVVYYYYYYDNDTNSNNLTLNFDDIPSLDSFDDTKSGKEPEKSASSRSIAANVNSLAPSTQEQPKENSQRAPTTPKASSPSGGSQPRSLSSSDAAVEPVIRADKPDNALEDTVVLPLKPVSNVFRYGSNEVPRFPVLPNFIVSEVPKEVKAEEQSTPDTLSTPPSTTLPASTASGILSEERLQPEVDNDDANNVLDSDTKIVEEHEEKATPESSTTTSTTTTTEPPTTTEVQTTTTEKSRRRPGGFGVGGRRRPGPSSAAPARSRQIPTRSATSSTTLAVSATSSTTAAPSSRRTSFRGSSSNVLRPRQPVGGNRPRTSVSTSSKPEDNEDSGSSKTTESTSTTASSRSRSTPAPRRFAGGRNSASRSVSTTSTTVSSRLRTTSRPRPNPITRNRPRPGFLRPRGGKEEEPEPVETTTPEPEVTEEKGSNSPSPAEETEPDDEEEIETTDTETPEAQEETEEPTTTEKNRFAALFRPRNRNGGGNRPRPVIANRPSRSRR